MYGPIKKVVASQKVTLLLFTYGLMGMQIGIMEGMRKGFRWATDGNIGEHTDGNI